MTGSSGRRSGICIRTSASLLLLLLAGVGCPSAPPAVACGSGQSDLAEMLKQKRDKFTMSCGACGRLVQGWWDQGVERRCQVKIKGKWVDQGPQIRFWTNGQKAFLTFSKNGSAYGPWRQWNPNGKLWVRGTLEKGSPVGLYEEWYSTGQPKMVGRYAKDGYPTGTWKYWTRSGKPTKTYPWP